MGSLRRRFGVLLSVVVLAGGLSASAADLVGAADGEVSADETDSVVAIDEDPGGSSPAPVGDAAVNEEPRDLSMSVLTEPEPVELPAEGDVVVDLGVAAPRARRSVPLSGGRVVSVSAPSRSAGVEVPAAVRVRTLSQAAVRAVGARGLIFEVERADGASAGRPGSVALDVDYSKFRFLFGGDFAQRMVLTRFPACAATTPERRACQRGVPVEFTNDTVTGRLRATVDLRAPQSMPVGGQVRRVSGGYGGRARVGRLAIRPSAASGGASSGVFGITTGPGGAGGTYSATPLAASGSWTVGQPSGSFSWSYPIEVPKATVGPAPSLAVGYSSQSVDGMTAAENTQAGPLGLGWDLSGLGSIDRRYMACNDDRQGQGWADQCWYYDNATITLNGQSSELVKQSETATTTSWRLKDDPNWRVTRSHTTNNNGDDDGEYWLVETPDGTKYYFGIGRQKDTTNLTNSVFTMPVFGNDANEPCHQSSVSTSWCDQAWRWNLDRIVDASGNTTTIFYEQETNAYLMRGGATPTTYASYVRAGHPVRIEYSQGQNSVATNPPTKVEFEYVDRCIAGLDNSTACPATIPANATEYPDVPLDLFCILQCSGWDHLSPTFFTTKRLKAIRTYTQDSSDSRVVDRYLFSYGYPTQDVGDVSPKLWLFTIARTGDPQGQNTTLPSVIFGGTQLANRADTGSGVPPTKLWRVSTVRNELGGDTNVTYGQQKPCNTGTGISDTWLPSPSGWDNNTYDCFIAYFDPPGTATYGPSINNKWLVKSVTLDDLTAGSPNVVYNYAYADTVTVSARWHHSDDPFEDDNHKTWSQWRGYSKITVTNSTTKTESRYYLGMDGDRKLNGTFPSVSVKQQSGATRPDRDELFGKMFETRSLSGTTELVRTTKYYWISNQPTATMTRPQYGDVKSWYIRDQKVDTLTNGTVDTIASKQMIYDSEGYLVVSQDLGDPLTTADDRCERFSYTRASDPWMRDRIYEQTLRDGAFYNNSTPTDSCTANTVIRRTQTFYDSHTALTGDPTRGLPTSVRQYTNDTTWVTTATSYDAYGRVASTTDADGNTTDTTYSPSGNALTDTVTVTPPRAVLATTTQLTDFRMAPKTVTTPQGTTTYTYDGLGRVTDVFLPGDPTSHASYQYTYTLSTSYNSPAKIRTEYSRDTPGTGTYVSSYKLLDGFGRERETQTVSPVSGKIVTATKYDARALAQYVSQPYNASGVAGNLNNAANGSIPTYVKLTYDALSRQTSSTTMSNGNIVTRSTGPTTTKPMTTTTAYDGLETTVTTPEGRQTESIVDVRGQTIETIDHGDSPATTSVNTTMQYSKRGELTTITDDAGHVTTMTYDWLGRRKTLDDPDMGTSTYQYKPSGLLELTTDSDPTTANIYTSYDNVGRPKERRANTSTGALLAQWSYYDDDNHATNNDGVKEGRLKAATSYDGTDAYVKTANNYDNRGNPTQVTYTIPASAGFSSTPTDYVYNTTYDNVGNIVSFTYPALGSLATETTTSTYNAVGLPNQLTSAATTYVNGTAWRPDGKLDGRTLGATPAGNHYVTRSYVYSPQTQRLKGIQASLDGNSTNFQSDAYSYDLDGNITAITDETNNQTQCFTYGGLGRLDHAWTTDLADCSDGTNWPNTHNTYGPDPYRLGYDYNLVGNITTRYDGTTNYNYDYANTNHPHAVTCVKPQSTACANYSQYTYDDNGQMKTRAQATSSTSLVWDDQHRLKTVTTPSGTQTNVYDADGQRILRVDASGTTTTRTLYLPNQELRASSDILGGRAGTTSTTVNVAQALSPGQYDGGTLTITSGAGSGQQRTITTTNAGAAGSASLTVATAFSPQPDATSVFEVASVATDAATRYYTLAGASVAVRAHDNKIHFLLGNHQGSASYAIDKTTGAIAQRRYLPFGAERTGTANTLPTQRGFIGQTEDPTTDLTYLNARYYDPNIGRFISVDPIGSTRSQTGGAYSYAGNNPVTASDASGLLPCKGKDCDEGLSCLSAPNPIECANEKAKRETPPPPPPDTPDDGPEAGDDGDEPTGLTRVAQKASQVAPTQPLWCAADELTHNGSSVCDYAFSIRNEVEAWAKKYGSANYWTNGQINAARHAYWSLLIGFRYGHDRARGFLAAHERDTALFVRSMTSGKFRENQLRDAAADATNNRVGLSLASALTAPRYVEPDSLPFDYGFELGAIAIDLQTVIDSGGTGSLIHSRLLAGMVISLDLTSPRG